MKCVEWNHGAIERISDDDAAAAVNAGKAKYVPRERWKKEVRDADKSEEKPANNLSTKKVRGQRKKRRKNR